MRHRRDDRGDYKGKEFAGDVAKGGALLVSASTDGIELVVSLQLFKDSIPAGKVKYSHTADKCKGVSEETITGAHRLKEVGNLYGVRHSLLEDIMCATGVMIGDKRAVICG